MKTSNVRIVFQLCFDATAGKQPRRAAAGFLKAGIELPPVGSTGAQR